MTVEQYLALIRLACYFIVCVSGARTFWMLRATLRKENKQYKLVRALAIINASLSLWALVIFFTVLALDFRQNWGFVRSITTLPAIFLACAMLVVARIANARQIELDKLKEK